MNDLISLKNIRSLDGLRAIAAILVVFFHCPIDAFQLRFGWVGVNLFFILSGFLITRILISMQGSPFNVTLKSFYFRRALRIFPLYFFYIISTFLLLLFLDKNVVRQDPMIGQGISDFKSNWLFLFSFTYNFEGIVNFLMAKSYSSSIFFGHLWTLSVEVQFYFLFPFILYFVPRAVLKKILVFTILFIPFFRLIGVLLLKKITHDLFWIGELLYESTPFQLDALSLGIYIALFDFKSILKYGLKILGGLLLLLMLVGFFNTYFLKLYGIPMDRNSLGFDNPVYHVVNPIPDIWVNNRYFYTLPLINLTFCLFLVLVKENMLLKKIFENRNLVWIGKISYGIYIYHLGLSYLFDLVVSRLVRKEFMDVHLYIQFGLLVVYLAILIALSALSYYLFENRILKYRNVNYEELLSRKL